MNTKTLISALVLTLGLGALTLPVTASARDYGNDRDRQEHRGDRHDNGRGDHNRHDRDRHDHRRHDNGHHHGHYRHYPYPYVGQYYWHNNYFLYDPRPIIYIEPRW